MTDPAGRAEAGDHEHALDQSPHAEAGVGPVRLPSDERHNGERDVLDEAIYSFSLIRRVRPISIVEGGGHFA